VIKVFKRKPTKEEQEQLRQLDDLYANIRGFFDSLTPEQLDELAPMRYCGNVCQGRDGITPEAIQRYNENHKGD